METIDKEREKHNQKNMEEMKRRYETENDKIWNLETRMDTMSTDQAEGSSATQSKLDVLLRNFIPQEKTIPDKTEKINGTRVDFVEPQRKKPTPLPLINNNIRSGMSKKATKGGVSNSTRTSRESSAHTSVTLNAMTRANSWEMMNTTLEAFATGNTESSDRGGGKSRKTFKKPKEFDDDSDGCIDTWVELMRLHLEQDNLNDDKQACTAILSNLEGTTLKCLVAKKEGERDTASKIFEILLNRFGFRMKGHQAMMRFKDPEMMNR